MFKRVLIANRGEIALRGMRACHEMGIEKVAVYSDADAAALHTKLAGCSYYIGASEASKSYLNKNAIIAAAKATCADAVHPGYGFLAEDAEFAQMVIDNGLTFIGPSPDVIKLLGDKGLSRDAMERAGLNISRGSAVMTSSEETINQAEAIGYPVILKSVSGGGGHGVFIALNRDELSSALARYKASPFAGTPYYLEKYFVGARHIEVQIAGDKFGNVIHLGERECSLQRRNQKIMEEAPSVVITETSRRTVTEMAVRAAKSLNYTSIGTVEFLMDTNGTFYFLEINPRVQVEHTITEMITGIDLVKTQIQLAFGQMLTFSQDDISFRGHAIECRINAEDPTLNFMSSCGEISFYHPPGGANVRVESGVYSGYVITPHYDSLIAKVIACGKTRGEAITVMRRALNEFQVEGIKTTIDFHKKVLKDPDFLLGKIDTQFIGKMLKQ
jgi:acetyl-CoA carboxylase biotin carboxylase subunit